MPFKMNKIVFIPENKSVPTLPKIFRPVTQNVFFFKFSGKQYNFRHFERQNAFQKFIKLYF